MASSFSRAARSCSFASSSSRCSRSMTTIRVPKPRSVSKKRSKSEVKPEYAAGRGVRVHSDHDSTGT